MQGGSGDQLAQSTAETLGRWKIRGLAVERRKTERSSSLRMASPTWGAASWSGNSADVGDPRSRSARARPSSESTPLRFVVRRDRFIRLNVIAERVE